MAVTVPMHLFELPLVKYKGPDKTLERNKGEVMVKGMGSAVRIPGFKSRKAVCLHEETRDEAYPTCLLKGCNKVTRVKHMAPSTQKASQ